MGMNAKHRAVEWLKAKPEGDWFKTGDIAFAVGVVRTTIGKHLHAAEAEGLVESRRVPPAAGEWGRKGFVWRAVR